MILNGETQWLDHLKGKRHRRKLKKARRQQMELKLIREPDDKAPTPQQDKGQPVAILAQESPNATDYMDRDVSIEDIPDSAMRNVHDSPRKFVDDQGLPDGPTSEMGKNKTRQGNGKREEGEV